MTQGIIDSHAHIIDPARFAYEPGGRGYMPKPHETGPAEAFRAVLAANGAGGALLVQPSCYGFDNTAMLDAIAGSPTLLRGIAVVDTAIPERDLEALAARGVVGVRFNLVSYDPQGLAGRDALRLLERLRALGLFAQVFASSHGRLAAAEVLRRSGVKVLVDHFGVAGVDGGLAQVGFQAVLALGRAGTAAVKLSAAFRIVRSDAESAALKPYADALIDAFGRERCVWGSDWPFINVDRAVTYPAAIAALERIVPDAAVRHAVLDRNPRALFGFAA